MLLILGFTHAQTNDNFEDAQELVSIDNFCSSPGVFTTSGATPDEALPENWTGGPYSNVWYKFTATTTEVSIRVEVGSMNFPRISLHDATKAEIKSVANAGSGDPVGMSVNTLTVGQEYYINVSNGPNGGHSGTFTLCVDDEVSEDYRNEAVILSHSNDNCSTSGQYDTRIGTPDGARPSKWGNGPNANIWFRFQATTSEVALNLNIEEVTQALKFPRMALYDDGETQPLVNVGNAGTNTNIGLSHTGLTVGAWYDVNIDNGPNTGHRGAFTLCIDTEVSHDYRSSAIALNDLNNYCSPSEAYTTEIGTPDEARPSFWTNGPNANVWFTFQAAGPDITIDVKTGTGEGTIAFPKLAIYNQSMGEVAGTMDAGQFNDVSLSYTGLVTGATYYINIDNGVNQGQRGTFTLCVNNPGTGPAVPDVPANLLAVSAGVDQINLSWDDVATETGYRLWRSTESGTGFNILAENIDDNTVNYSDIGLTPNTPYFYYLEAFNDSGSSVPTVEVSATTDELPDPGTEQGRTFLIDLGNPTNITAGNWNNVTSPQNDGVTISDLIDDSGASSTIDFVVVIDASNGLGNGFNNDGYSGETLGYPITANSDSYFARLGGGTYKLTELDNNKTYDLVIFGSRSGTGNRVGTYTINGVTKTLDGLNNTSNTVSFTGLTPDVNGEIILDFGVQAGSSFGYLNVLKVIEQGATLPPTAPSNLSATVSDNDIQLNWTNNASTATNFEIERATLSGGYSSIAIVPVETTSFDDNDLPSDTYRYRVKAIDTVNDLQSDFSSEVNATVEDTDPGTGEQRTFLIDLGNPTNTTSGNWNNLGIKQNDGVTVSGLIDDKGLISSIGFTVVKDASEGFGNGYNNAGYAGEALGYPVTANSDSYFSQGAGGTYKLTGLDNGKTYDLVIFASRAGSGNRVGTYTINGVTQTLDALNNSTNTISFIDLQPDDNNEIILDFGVEAGSSFGYLNVLEVIEKPSQATINAPSNLTAVASPGQVVLSWADNSDNETGFEIRRSTTENDTNDPFVTVAVNATQFIDYTVDPSTLYYYQVRSTDGQVLSSYTDEVSVNSAPVNTGIVPDAQEILALRELYTETTGAEWINRNGWPNSSAEWDNITSVQQAASWHGITVEDGDVVELRLPDDGLNGYLLPSLGDLTALRVVDLAYNNLFGSSLEMFGNLRELTSLYLNNCDLADYIPVEIGNCTKLESLVLGNNALTGKVPGVLGELTNLRLIYLDNNDLYGPLPNSLTSLSNLTKIVLSNNSFNTFPNFSSHTNPSQITVRIASNNISDVYIQPHLDEVAFGSFSYLPQDVSPINGQVPDEVEIQALRDLYENTGGNSWVSQTDANASNNWANGVEWNIITSVDQVVDWHGLTLLNGDIDIISLVNNDLSGSLPESMADLKGLRYLQITHNALSGSLPSGIGELNKLIWLNMRDNELTGSIPNSLAYNSSITKIELINNQLSGSLPPFLGDIVNLQTLELGNNNFSGPVPSTLGNLSNLTELRLALNDLAGEIPTELGDLSNLKTLQLSFNNLIGSIPSSFSGLTSLENLSLGSNQLSGPIPIELGSLTTLVGLHLGYNNLTGNIPKEIGDMTALVVCDLGNNDLSGSLPTEIGNLASLVSLSVVDNNLLGAIPNSLVSIESLGSMQLHRNNFTSFPDFTNHLSPLNIYVDISYNYIPQEDIDVNLVEGVPIFSTFNYVPQNTIPTEQGQIFDVVEIQALRDLYNIKDAPPSDYYWGGWPQNDAEWDNITSLNQVVDWNGVTIEDGDVVDLNRFRANLVGKIPESISNLSELKVLQLLQNRINQIPAELSELSKLEFLGLSSNSISSLPEELGDLKQLKTLGLDYNPIDYIPEFTRDLESLERLTMQSTGVNTKIPEWIGELDNLELLNIQESQVAGEMPAAIGNLNKLKSLYLANTNIKGSIPSSIANIDSLLVIYLQNTEISGQIPTELASMDKLIGLDISNSDVEGIPNFNFLPNAQSLRLRVNGSMLSFQDVEKNLIGPDSHSYLNFFYANLQSPVEVTLLNVDPAQPILNDRGGGSQTSYQWQEWNGTDWINIDSQTTEHLMLTDVDQSFVGRRYRCEMTNGWVIGQTLYSTIFEVSSVQATYYAIANGDWTDGTIWSLEEGGEPVNQLPTAADKVVINGFSINASTIIESGDLTLDANDAAQLILSGPNAHLTVRGKISIKGDFRFAENILIVKEGAKLDCIE
ncbi:MAG: hypothetical protein AAF363_07875 [Bacteroidota bacterium]